MTSKKRILIIGGAGFIGVNAARHFAKKGWQVTVFDNLSRKGAEYNLMLLRKDFPKVRFVKGNIVKDIGKLEKAVRAADAILHLAAQVAVTTSIADPRNDFIINALGTFNVLEAVRQAPRPPILLYASTNKVYGSLEHRTVKEGKTRYRFSDPEIERFGVSESEPLDFHSPYGCSKGSADQYIIDYARIFNLRTVVFRQSCIYGEYQFGVEDQGWVAWFVIAAMLCKPITIYGNGKQVRDVLYVGDLVALYDRAIENINRVSGQAFNVGGGPQRTTSLLEFLEILERRYGALKPKKAAIRAGDQPIFVADNRKAGKLLGWKPTTKFSQGLKKLISWTETHQKEIKKRTS